MAHEQMQSSLQRTYYSSESAALSLQYTLIGDGLIETYA